MKNYLVLLMFLVFALSSCKKIKELIDTACKLDQNSFNGNYKITSAVTNGGQEIFYDDNYYPPCVRDDVYKFLPPGVFTFSDGSNSCSPPANNNGSWSFVNGTKLYINSAYVGDISDYKCGSFKLTYSSGSIQITETWSLN